MMLHHCLSQAELTITGYDRDKAMAVGRIILAQHRRLVEAIECGRASEARQIIEDHLRNGPEESIQ